MTFFMEPLYFSAPPSRFAVNPSVFARLEAITPRCARNRG
jgi:hypothetical protein